MGADVVDIHDIINGNMNTHLSDSPGQSAK